MSGSVATGAADLGDYVAEICGELVGMTTQARLPLLAYFLSMARTEAERISRDGGLPE